MADTPLQIAGREDKTEPRVTVAGVLVNAAKGAVADVQDYAKLCGRTLVTLVTPPFYLQDVLQQMDSIGAVYTFIGYDSATHAFTNPASTVNGQKFHMPIAYNEKADTASWEAMKNFFAGVFGK